MIFTSSEHAERFGAAIQTAGAVRKDDTIKGDFGASLFILAGIPSAYGSLKQHIHDGWLDFESMLRSGLSAGESVLVALAGNLYNNGYFDRYTPFDILNYCDIDGVLLAARALSLRKQRLNFNTILNSPNYVTISQGMVDNAPIRGYNISTAGNPVSTAASARKENQMDEDMNLAELLKETVEENQTRKILEILHDCKDLDDGIEKVKALLNK